MAKTRAQTALTAQEAARYNSAFGASLAASLIPGQRLQSVREDLDVTAALLALATAGVCPRNTLVMSSQPANNDTVTIASTVFQFKTSGNVTNDAYVGVLRGADAAEARANLLAAVNRTYGQDAHRSLFKVDGVTPALAQGNVPIRTVAPSTSILAFPLDIPGPKGVLVTGTAPDIAFDASLTSTQEWTFANMNLANLAGTANRGGYVDSFTVTTAMVNAGTYVFDIGYYAAGAYVLLECRSSAGVPKISFTDSATITAGPLPGLGTVTITLPNSGPGDFQNTNVVTVRVFGPQSESLPVPVELRQAFDGRLDQLTAQLDALETEVAALTDTGTQLYTFTGAGDSLDLSDTNPHVFTSKATLPASAGAVGDWLDYEAYVLVTAASGTPLGTMKLLWGALELDSQAITTTAAADYVIIKGKLRITGATACLLFKGRGWTKDSTIATQTLVAPATGTSPALTAATDFTVSFTINGGTASVTLVSLEVLHSRVSS